MGRLSAVLPSCSRLERLLLSGNGAITDLPHNLGELPPPPRPPFVRGMPQRKESSRHPSLLTLELIECSSLRTLPESLCLLLNLRELRLDWCMRLHSLPDGIGALRELRVLTMKGCEMIHGLPEGVGALRAIEALDLGFCASLGALPAGLGGARTLQSLNLYGCRNLIGLPAGLEKLLDLHFLCLNGCTKLIGLDMLTSLGALEERGCNIEYPPEPPPKVAAMEPTYQFAALDVYTRILYGLDEANDVKTGDERAPADATASADAADLPGYGTGAIELAPDRYEGKWKDGKQEGRGTYWWADGRAYVGQWRNGKMEGGGSLRYGPSNEYEGEFREGRPWGQGVRRWADGETYEGAWVAGKQEGYGVMTYASGDTYEGEWVDSLREGAGVYTYRGGDAIVGEWVRGTHKRSSGAKIRGSARLVGKEAASALLQENSERRTVIAEIRGGCPLAFRRPKTRLPLEMLRAENARLAEFIRAFEHLQFKERLREKRTVAQAAIAALPPPDAAPRRSSRSPRSLSGDREGALSARSRRA